MAGAQSRWTTTPLSKRPWWVVIEKNIREVNLKRKAFQTWHGVSSRQLARKVRREGGAFHVFLTGNEKLDFTSVDDEPERALKQHLKRLLDDGVDGIMTDYPKKVHGLLKDLT